MAAQQVPTITPVDVAPGRFGLWGVSVKDYVMDGVPVDFETIVVAVATRRAATVEREIQPLTTQMMVRNRKLKDLGDALGDLTRLQVLFKPDSAGSEMSHDVARKATIELVDKLIIPSPFVKAGSNIDKISKADLERTIQVVKSAVEKLNNEMQTDTTRTQSYIQKRDDSFSMASSIMASTQNSRKDAIAAMGG